MSFLGVDSGQDDRVPTVSISKQPYNLNAVPPQKISASKTDSYEPKKREAETDRVDWIDEPQPRDTRLFIDFEGKPLKKHCKHFCETRADKMRTILSVVIVVVLLAFFVFYQ
ncbi:Oidioi.mRNA.OKI2018_I69.PAR.g11131.t1.cds [Oikopleura dioica]|uniref:Oidioi.mRNA.OKI2018_I69.PAR.g11131.t1.cds n=1 Tax=Oikopleura dioica TaxID=34765 RepID=A0ABN7S029_OIKDI|nr:Oidioi.mRNA.OKI2018_I69.PAR.g11131.t1.cds [Oikopleura dioica]